MDGIFDPMVNVYGYGNALICLEFTEDTYTMGNTIPFLVPKLENAGAYVFTPRERDTQSTEVLVDNDPTVAVKPVTQRQTGAKSKWRYGGHHRISQRKKYYKREKILSQWELSVNVKQGKKRKTLLSIGLPNIPEKGDYAVYISYKISTQQHKRSHYTVHPHRW
jgi:hypothetical protein